MNRRKIIAALAAPAIILSPASIERLQALGFTQQTVQMDKRLPLIMPARTRRIVGKKGILRPYVAAIGVVGVGADSATSVVPAGVVAGDYLVSFTVTESGFIGGNAQGFSSIDGSNGSGLGATSVRGEIFGKVATGSDANPNVTLSNSPCLSVIIAIRGANTTPHAVANAGVAASTSVSMPILTTTVDNCLILQFLGWSNTGALSSIANANLSGISTLVNETTALDDDAGIAIWAGYKDAAGAIGATTATLASSSTQSKFTLALAPA